MTDIVERLRRFSEPVGGGSVSPKDLAKEAADEIERLREALRKIANIEHENIPAPQTSNEGVTWTVLAMAVGLAEKALKEDE
jgi:hypothetical protein